jgi:hypothetical protein
VSRDLEITGAHALEASDRAIFNQLLQIAHDSDKLIEPDAEWEITLSSLRRASSKHESNDRVRESLRRLRRTEVKVTYVSARTGKQRVMETHLLEFTDTDEEESSDPTRPVSCRCQLPSVRVACARLGLPIV